MIVTRQGLDIGRAPTNGLTLPDSQISRHHMRIAWQDDAFWVEDLNSGNGVRLNGTRIPATVLQRLNEGDVIIAGPYSLTLEEIIVPEEAPPPAPAEPAPPAVEVPPAPAPAPVPQPLPVTPSVTMESRPQYKPVVTEDVRLPMPIFPPSPPAPNRIAPPTNGHRQPGIPTDKSNWLRYLPAIYSEDEFVGRYLLIFESMLSPIMWLIDNFDMYLSPETAPAEWLQWMASWFDVLILPELPIERQRAVARQIGWLFFRRGTRLGLERLLELYFGVKPEIVESEDVPCHFIVRLPLRNSGSSIGREVAERLIIAQKPAFTGFALEIV